MSNLQYNIFYFLNKQCFDILNISINSNYIHTFFKMLKISLLLSIIFIFGYMLYFVFYKKNTLKGFFLEYKSILIQYSLVYILNIYCFLFLNELFLPNLNKFSYLFRKTNSFQNTIFLLIFVVCFLKLFLCQISDIIESLILILIEPFFMFNKDKLKKFQNLNIKNICRTLYLNIIYFCLINIKSLNQFIFMMFLIMAMKSDIFHNLIIGTKKEALPHI